MLPASLPLQRLPRLCSSLSGIPIPSDSQYYANLLISYSKQSVRHPFDESPQRVQTLGTCKIIHGRILRLGLDLSDKLGNALIDLYSKSGEPSCAQKAFNLMEKPDQISWNSILSAYLRTGSTSSVLISFTSMLRSGFSPDQFSFATALSACARLSAVMEGKKLHCYIIKAGLSSNRYCEGSLVDMYAKSGQVSDACQVFDEISEPDIIAWTNLIAGYDQAGMAEESLRLFSRMCESGIVPDRVMMVAAMTACFSLGRLEDARSLFKQIQSPNNVAWNAVISGLAQNGHEAESLDVVPDQVSCSSIISACSDSGAIDEGKQMHCLSIKVNLSSNVYVGSSLIDFYGKLGEMEDADLVFLQLTEKTLPARNALINGYVQNNKEEQALIMFQEMQIEGINPSTITFGSILPACGGPFRVTMGKLMHCYMLKSGLICSDDFLKANLLVMYLRSKLHEDANKLFLEIPVSKSLVIWTVVISGYSQNGFSDEALLLFQEMRMSDLGFDEAILASALGACADLAALGDGRKVHSIVIRTAFQSYKHTSIALIDMYSKCGDVESSQNLFEEAKHKEDVILWNSLIVGLAKNGYAIEALEIFYQLQQSRINPDDISFLGVLTACSHAGLIDEGRSFFKSMTNNYGIIPRAHHYACMIDLLGRGGHLKEAEELINKLPLEPNGLIWATMLAASRMHEDSERGEYAADKLTKLEPYNSSPYVLLSSIYGALGNWDGVKRLRHAMKLRGVQKVPGCSWIEVRNKTSLFIAGDKFHPNANEICQVLNDLTALMKDVDCVSDIISLLLDEDEVLALAL
ncbi:hypothetical protein M5K25_009695 [Dendrobium thyrsiflorum]|uniref:Pentatricopeptide repeat-containing protein n=1 Tax=Dendrobium thyrsiflorum TaxID=117978 RepID=A0ABD0V6G3_DENTH